MRGRINELVHRLLDAEGRIRGRADVDLRHLGPCRRPHVPQAEADVDAAGSRDRITESRDLLMRLELDERMRTDRGEGSAAIARRLAGKRAQHV